MSLTQQELKAVLHYDPATGKFTRIKASTNHQHLVGFEAGGVDRKGYRKIKVNYKEYFAHRLAFLYMTGQLPTNFVDHIDRNPANNCWDNLREIDPMRNSHNRNRSKANTSGHTGVKWLEHISKYSASIGHNRKHHLLGYYQTMAEAIEVRKAASKRLRGEYFSGE